MWHSFPSLFFSFPHFLPLRDYSLVLFSPIFRNISILICVYTDKTDKRCDNLPSEITGKM